MDLSGVDSYFFLSFYLKSEVHCGSIWMFGVYCRWDWKERLRKYILLNTMKKLSGVPWIPKLHHPSLCGTRSVKHVDVFVFSFNFYYHLHGSFSFPLFELDILQHPRRNRSCCSRSGKYGKGTSMGQRTPYWKVLEYRCPEGWMWQNLWLSWSLHFR